MVLMGKLNELILQSTQSHNVPNILGVFALFTFIQIFRKSSLRKHWTLKDKQIYQMWRRRAHVRHVLGWAFYSGSLGGIQVPQQGYSDCYHCSQFTEEEQGLERFKTCLSSHSFQVTEQRFESGLSHHQAFLHSLQRTVLGSSFFYKGIVIVQSFCNLVTCFTFSFLKERRPVILFLGVYKINAKMFTQRLLHKYLPVVLFIIDQNLEQFKGQTDEQVNKWGISYSSILLGNKKEQPINTHNHVDRFQNKYAQQKVGPPPKAPCIV